MSADAEAVDLFGAQRAGPTLAERIELYRRRTRPALVALGGGLALALLAAFLWPPTYRSSGTVLIEQQEVPEEFVLAAVTSFADQRVRVISQRVMTTSNLLEIINKFDLYPERRKREPRERLLERMRDDIGLEMISADVVDPRQGRPTKATIAFTVSFDSRSPQLAAKVANELTTLYLRENLENRKQKAADTAEFLKEEAERVGAELADLDRRVAEFKSRHGDSLPEVSPVNIQLMTRADEELRTIETRVNSLSQQIVYLDAQLAQIEPTSMTYGEGGQRVLGTPDRLKLLRMQLASASAVYGAEHPDVLRLQREIAGLEKEVGQVDSSQDLVRQLTETKSQLAQARNRYSSEHPDVRSLERVVAAIEDAMRRSSQTAPSLRQVESPDNPAFIQIQAQREAAVNEQAALRGQREQLRARIADYESRLSAAPAVEQEYNALMRDLQGAQFKYQEVRQKEMAALVSENLESEQKGERFTLIEPPLVPEQPSWPNRPLVLLLGLMASLAAAIGIPMLLEAVDGSVRGQRDLTRLVTAPPLAVIPWISTDEEVETDTRRRRWALLGGVLAVIVIIVLVHALYRPLDVILAVLLRRIGI
jgi:polysaccharide biosynthesis transport protein